MLPLGLALSKSKLIGSVEQYSYKFTFMNKINGLVTFLMVKISVPI